MMPSPPPAVTDLPYGTTLVAGLGFSTVIADMDFEMYSEAGYRWDEEEMKWGSPSKGEEGGLPYCGMQQYAEHPTTEILSLAYNLKDGRGQQLWFPGMPLPQALFDHLAAGKLIEAFYAAFEERMWRYVAVQKYGFPSFPVQQLRCAAAKSRAHCLPGKLEKVGEALRLNEDDLKMKEGKALIKRYCCPRTPTKKDPRTRIHPLRDGVDGFELYTYNLQDIHTEAVVSARAPDMPPEEIDYWLVDQECNRRGVRVDQETMSAMIEILDNIYAEANSRVYHLTGGLANTTSEVARILGFLAGRGLVLSNLDGDTVSETLSTRAYPDDVCKELLEIRYLTSAASVKKAYAMRQKLSKDGKLHDMFVYHSARTGRDAGVGVQPQNMYSGGPEVAKCLCGLYFNGPFCDGCGVPAFQAKPSEWCFEAAEQAIHLIRARDVAGLKRRYGSATEAMSGCMRALFIPDPGYDFIATDYSSIEAVVAAALAGEQWRLDTFAAKECIYLASVSRIKGISTDEYKAYKASSGMHHPDRKIGKVAELASGFGGWVGAYKAFGAEEALGSEDAIKKAILAWREASPAIVEMWGGQFRGKPWERKPELYGLEGCAIQAVQYPGTPFSYRGIEYRVHNDVLYCTLLSGRRIAYHEPRLTPDAKRGGVQLSFMGWNTNQKMGAVGWVRMFTYGGKLFENVVQATARDILAHAAINCERRGYAVVLRVHDELVTMVRKLWGSVEELEAICGELPTWAKGWPVRATGGWRGERYRKD
jgi:DNA polymerase